MTAHSEAWKYTPVRELLAALGPTELAAVLQDARGDRGGWGLSRLVDAVAQGPGGAGDTVTGPGVSAARRRWHVTTGAEVWSQRVSGGGTHVSHDVVEVAEGATAVHVRVVDLAPDARHAGRVSVVLHAGARYELVSVLGGGAMVRVDVEVHLAGRGAHAELSGLTVARGDRHADHHVTVHHEAPACSSAQDFRALVDDAARSVFTGKVIVSPGADGADAAQLHRALLLSERAVAKARPQLEIHTDEVKASHGTAVGSLDPEALFYLRQRGLDPQEARALLVDGFAAAIVDRAPEGLRAALAADVVRWRTAP